LFVFFTFLQPIDFYTAEKYARRAGRRCFALLGFCFAMQGHSRARAYSINTSAEKYKQGWAAFCCIAVVLFEPRRGTHANHLAGLRSSPSSPLEYQKPQQHSGLPIEFVA
jgi:hypothetical protein